MLTNVVSMDSSLCHFRMQKRAYVGHHEIPVILVRYKPKLECVNKITSAPQHKT
jgi:hypothetical protein